MKVVVIVIERPGSIVNVTVTFDDNPFELLDESDKPQNADEEQKQLISLAQSIVAKKIDDLDIDFEHFIPEQKLRTHVLISGKKDGILQVKYTTPFGISRLDTPPSLETALKSKTSTAKLASTYGEIGAEQTLRLPRTPEDFLQILQGDKQRAATAKKQRDLAKQKEEFLTKGPIKFPDPAVFPASIKTTAEKDIDLKKAVEKLSALYGEQSELNSVREQIGTVETQIEELEKELTQLKKKEASLNDTMSQDTVVSFAQSHLQTSKSELEKTRKLLEITVSTLRTNLSKAKSSFEKHVKSYYGLYEKYENAQEFTKQVMLTALYNAALDNYKKLLEDTKGKPEARRKMVEDFNKHFGGIAIIDEYGKVNPIEETYKSFADITLLEVESLANEVIKGTESKFIETWLAKANTHCENQYKPHFSNLIYKDQKQTTPFIMEKSFSIFGSGSLQQISINTKFDTDLDTPIQAASAHTKLDAERSKIPDEKAIGVSQSHLKTAQTKLTALEQKVTNFQRYIAIKAELEAKKVLASNQKKQIDEVTESFNKARDSIANQIQHLPADVQKHVLQNIKPQLAKAVFNQLSETNRESLIKVLPWLTAIPEESDIKLVAQKYEVLSKEIATASKNLSQIKEEDIRGEQLDNLLAKVKESELDESTLNEVIKQSDSYTQDDLSVDYLIFQQQLINAKKILEEQIQDVEKKLEMLNQANVSKEWLTTFEGERRSLIGIVSSFDDIEYQPNQTEKNKEELQRLTQLAIRSHEKILSEYQQINERIKSSQESQTVQQSVVLETPQPVISENTEPSPPRSKKQIKPPPQGTSETPPTPNKGALSRRKPESTIETKIREIYDKYFEQVKAETEKLSQKEPLKWQELFKEHKNQEGDLEDFKKEYIRDEESKIKEEKAVDSLNEIIDLIEKTEWKTGLFGSKSKIKINEKDTKVPNHIYEIYQQAKKGIQEPKEADRAMNEINKIATRAISYSDKLQFFRKRDEQTQQAYEAIVSHSKPR
ncbi:hypothetical protein [Legionella sp. 227]|uniref:hypothetical protein n=1 Tax=Legionella sp. 227 TaxID=3367288 RepID=UPI00370D1A9E